MADLDLNDLAVFVRVVERGGFAKAARELGVPTSTISRTVARLESLVGARLLHRTTRSVQPTSDGRELFDTVSAAVATLQQATRGLEPATGKPQGRLRMTAPNDLANTILADLIVQFVERHPLVEVEMVATNRTVNLVDEGFDLAIRAGRLADSSLVARKVGELEACLYASPEYIAKHGAPSTTEDLARHTLVVFRAKDGKTEWPLEGAGRSDHVRVHGRIGGDDFTFVHSIVISGGGVGLVPRIICAQDEAEGRLVRVLPDLEMRGAPLHVVYPTARHVPARVTAFRDFLVEAFAASVARCKEKSAQTASATIAARKRSPSRMKRSP